MSDHFFVLTFPDLPEANALTAAEAARAHLISRGLIAEQDAPDAVLSSGAHMVCPPASEFARQHGIQDLRTNGVAIHAPRYFNSWALAGTLICPKCDVLHGDDAGLIDRLGNALMAFSNGEPAADVDCPACGAATPASQWRIEENALAGTLGIEFWNWPSPQGLGLPDELAAVTGRARVDSGFVRI